MDTPTVLEKLRIVKPRRAKKLNIRTRKLMNTPLLGSFRSMVRGKGLEFDGYKSYMAGYDDAKYIDWKASVRANELLVKQFKEERDITVMFVLDGGSNMIFASKDMLKVEYAIDIISTMAYNSLMSGDRVGLLIHGTKMKKYIPPSTGRDQYHKMINALGDPGNYGGPSDLTGSLKYLTTTLGRNTVLFILSDFLYTPDTVSRMLNMASTKFDTMCIIIYDPRDLDMPQERIGEVAIRSPQNDEVILFDPYDIREEYAAMARQQLEETKRALTGARVDTLFLMTEEDYLPKMVNFFSGRNTRWK